MVCEELHNLYSSPLISTTTEWAGRVERMSIMCTKFRPNNLKSPLEDPETDLTIILMWKLEIEVSIISTEFSWLPVGTNGGTL
jgi:hypothetical protein